LGQDCDRSAPKLPEKPQAPQLLALSAAPTESGSQMPVRVILRGVAFLSNSEQLSATGFDVKHMLELNDADFTGSWLAFSGARSRWATSTVSNAYHELAARPPAFFRRCYYSAAKRCQSRHTSGCHTIRTWQVQVEESSYFSQALVRRTSGL
jgi:hypothetical protein